MLGVVWQDDGMAMDLPAVPRKARTGGLGGVASGDVGCEFGEGGRVW